MLGHILGSSYIARAATEAFQLLENVTTKKRVEAREPISTSIMQSMSVHLEFDTHVCATVQLQYGLILFRPTVLYRALYASLNRMRRLDRYFTGQKRNRRNALRVGGVLEETILREGGDDDLVTSLGVIVE